MKISDIKGMVSFDFIAEIEEYAEKIFSDKEIREKFFSEKKKNSEEELNIPQALKNIQRVLNYDGSVVRIMCSRYRNETANILAILNNTTVENLTLSPFEIIQQIKELLTELGTDGIKLFFSSAQKTEDKSSGSATENTEETILKLSYDTMKADT